MKKEFTDVMCKALHAGAGLYFDSKKCIACYRCIGNCPEKAITCTSKVMLSSFAILIPSVVLIDKLRKIIYTIAEEKWRKEYETKQEMAQIAHDLKTPLTVIRGNADLLLEKEQDEDSLDSINTFISNSERIGVCMDEYCNCRR